MGCNSVAHFLDDFLFCGKRNSGKCSFISNNFQALAKEMGLSLAEEKTEGSATSLTFLGIELDTMQQTSWLPLNKLVDLRSRIVSLLHKKKGSLREL